MKIPYSEFCIFYIKSHEIVTEWVYNDSLLNYFVSPYDWREIFGQAYRGHCHSPIVFICRHYIALHETNRICHRL